MRNDVVKCHRTKAEILGRHQLRHLASKQRPISSIHFVLARFALLFFAFLAAKNFSITAKAATLLQRAQETEVK